MKSNIVNEDEFKKKMVDYSINQGLNYFLIDHTLVIMKFENV